MPSDVSDEALDAIVEQEMYGYGVLKFQRKELLAFAKRIRDMTKDACLSAVLGEQLEDPAGCCDDAYEVAIGDCANAIAALFPGAAAAEGEARDGKNS